MATGGSESVNVRVDDKRKCGFCNQFAASDRPIEKFCGSCITWLCRTCLDNHAALPGLKFHKLYDDDTNSSPVYTACEVHNRSNLIYYCTTCCDAVCSECMSEGDSKHEMHITIDIEEKAKQNQEAARSNLEENENLKKALEQKKLDACHISADGQLSQDEQKVCQVFEQIRKENAETRATYLKEVDTLIASVDEKIQISKECLQGSGSKYTMTDLALMNAAEVIDVPEIPTFHKGLFVVADHIIDMACDVGENHGRQSARGEQISTVKSLLNITTKCNEHVEQNLLHIFSSFPCTSTLEDKAAKICLTSVNLASVFDIVRHYLRRQAIHLFQTSDVASLMDKEVTLISKWWVESYHRWLNETGNSFPPALLSHRQHRRKYVGIFKEDVFATSVAESKTLRLIFGSEHPLPVMDGAKLVKTFDHSQYFAYYIIGIQDMTCALNASEKPSVTYRIFHGSENLPSGRLFHNDIDVTDICMKKNVCNIFVDVLKLAHYDVLTFSK